jgi:putative transcription antitermination factor YqgF
MSYIGIDYGEKRVGIAVSDEGAVMAFPVEVVARKDALQRVTDLVREREATTIIIGESKDFHNEDNPVMAAIRSFAEELREKTGATIILEPEFLTSAGAKSAGASDRMLDASAAAIILQSFLDKKRSGTLEPMEEKPAEVPVSQTIDIDTFKKLDIRIGEVISAEKVENADKLLRLRVSFGPPAGGEERQIISGISAYFPEPQSLVGKKVAFAYNLAPRKIRGYESQGMILAAMDDEGNFSLLESSGVAAGARIK